METFSHIIGRTEGFPREKFKSRNINLAVRSILGARN